MLAPPDQHAPAACSVVEDDVWAWNAARLEFDRLRAIRHAPDTWEITTAPKGASCETGDLVMCELSDGELLMRERVWTGRLL